MEIMIKPIVTEKATQLTERRNPYTIRASTDANKHQAHSLAEQLHGAKDVSVNTAIVRGKNKSRWTKSGLLRGKTAAYKKAYITVGEGQTIDIFSNI